MIISAPRFRAVFRRSTRHGAVGEVMPVVAILYLLAFLLPVEAPGQRPDFVLREHQTAYHGPGRDLPAPTDVTEIAIAFFGPSDPEDPITGTTWQAIQLAVDQENASRAPEAVPIKVIPIWSDDPWGSGVQQLARAIYQERIWAIIGGTDGPSTHLAEQLAVKARIALVSPAASDKTVNLINIPWMFSLCPSDDQLAEALAESLAAPLDHKKWTLITTTDHDSRLQAKEILNALGQRHIAPDYRFSCRPGFPEFEDLVDRVLQARNRAVLIVAHPWDSARLVKALRDRGFNGLIAGGSSMGDPAFAREAGKAAEGVIYPLRCRPGYDEGPFAEAFRNRFGRLPDQRAALAYDGTQLVMNAIRRAGLNRALIRDAIAECSPWPGVSGPVQWDHLGRNCRSATVTRNVFRADQSRTP